MDNEGDNEESILQKKKAAALQRVSEHIAWKRAFFQARPAPPPIGQLHRRQQGKTKNMSCHTLFQTALALHHEKTAREEEETSALTTSPCTACPDTLSKQEAWAAQLHREKERRNPATDLNVRSDPLRTVIMANLHPDTVDEDVRHFADQFGRVVHVRIVRHHKTGKSRRYAFVEFGLAGEARRALQFHRKKRLKGHAIIIDREKGRTEAGFLPSRMAAAEAFLSFKTSRNATGSSDANVAATAEGRQDSTSATSLPPSGEVAAQTPAIPDNDDDFLNSILNS